MAGASAEPERVRAAMDAVEREGWTVALDWLAAIEAEGTANDMDATRRAYYAAIDGRAVARADVLWLLAPSVDSTGSWVELGIAQALGVPTVTSWNGPRRCIYAALGREVDDDARAIEALRIYEE